MKKNKVIFNGEIDKLRPTVNKNVFISDDYRLLRVSKLDNTPIDENMAIEIAKKIKKSNSNGVIFSDFRHGIFSKRNINIFKKAIPKNKFTAEHLEKYANKAKVRMDIRKLAQNDANVADRCMPNENLREILLLEIFQEMSLQNAG